MKKLFLIVAILVFGHIANAQVFIDELFSKYAGKQGFTSVVIAPQVFKLLAFVDESDSDLQSLSEKLNSFRILVSEDKAIGFTDDIKIKIEKMNYLNIMQVLDGEQKVNFYVKQNGETITDFILLAIDGNEEVLMSITGNMKMKELANLGKSKGLGKSGHLSLLKSLEEK